MNSTNRDIELGLGFILGMAAGLALGFIFAPEQGKDIRGLIKDKIVDTGEKVLEIAADVGGTLQEVVGDREKIYMKTWKQPKVEPYKDEF
jgi:gas vesicle protein